MIAFEDRTDADFDVRVKATRGGRNGGRTLSHVSVRPVQWHGDALEITAYAQ